MRCRHTGRIQNHQQRINVKKPFLSIRTGSSRQTQLRAYHKTLPLKKPIQTSKYLFTFDLVTSEDVTELNSWTMCWQNLNPFSKSSPDNRGFFYDAGFFFQPFFRNGPKNTSRFVFRTCALRFPQGKDPCGIPQGHGFFSLWDLWIFENLSLTHRRCEPNPKHKT